MHRWRPRLAALVLTALTATAAVVGVGPLPSTAPRPTAAQAAVPVPGAGAPRPRLLYEPGAEDLLRDRLDREPYRTVFLRMHQQAQGWQTTPLGDLGVAPQRNLLRVAKVRAFQYALDRTVVDGQVVPFPAAARATRPATSCCRCSIAAAWRCRRPSAGGTATSPRRRRS